MGSEFDLQASELRITYDPDGDKNLSTSARSDGLVLSKPRFGLVGAKSLRLVVRQDSNRNCSATSSPARGRTMTIVWEPSSPITGQPLGWTMTFSALVDDEGVIEIDGLPTGRYLIGVQGSNGADEVRIGQSGESDVRLCVAPVTSGGARLPGTGSSSSIVLLTGLVLILIGFSLSRRRTREVH